MAMNNWGGVTEHMYKMPRKFRNNKKFIRSKSRRPNVNLKVEINDKRVKKIYYLNLIKEFSLYIVIFIIAGVLMYNFANS